MAFSLKTVLSTSALLAAVAFAQPALADGIIFQTATTDPNALANDVTFPLQGDGTTGNSLAFGADFTLTAGSTQIGSIGAAFGDTANTSGGGSIFGMIVAVDPTTGLPTQTLESLFSGAASPLASVVFTPGQDGDTTATFAQPVTLAAGTYAVVFGSGLFGTTGVADLLAGEDTVGSPFVFEDDFGVDGNFNPLTGSFGPASENDVRLFVDAVPEPASFTIIGAGLLLLTGLVRRRA